MQDIQGATVWVTGAGSGIGAAMAKAFAAAGCAVALTGRRAAPLDALASDIGPAAKVYPANVTDGERMIAIANAVAQSNGRLDVVCNNAGTNIPNRTWEEFDRDSWGRVFDVNVKGPLGVIAAALPIMRDGGGGLFIHTSSYAGRFHMPVAGAAYGASKHALSELSASLNSSQGRYGIRSCALCPGEVATELLTGRPGWDTTRNDKIIQPHDVAEAALFVARMNPNVSVSEITLAPVRR